MILLVRGPQKCYVFLCSGTGKDTGYGCDHSCELQVAIVILSRAGVVTAIASSDCEGPKIGDGNCKLA